LRAPRLARQAQALRPKIAPGGPEAFDTTDATERPLAKANKGKSMKAKLLSFAFIYFSESGLFNGLRSIQIKKTAAFSTPAVVVRVNGPTRFIVSHFAHPCR
jgi:hypothetical protein